MNVTPARVNTLQIKVVRAAYTYSRLKMNMSTANIIHKKQKQNYGPAFTGLMSK